MSARHRFVSALACAALVGEAEAAPPIPYGGEARLVAPSFPLADVPWPLASPMATTLDRARFEPLLTRDPAEDGVLPGLAASVEQDGTTVRLSLGRGLRRHDGRPLGAEDVVGWFEDAARPGSPRGHLVLAVEGGRARLSGRDVPLGVRALDDRQLEIRLAYPDPEWVRGLTRPEAGVFVRTARGPVGTGAFRAVPERADRLAAFPGHRDGRPYLDGLVVRPTLRPSTADVTPRTAVFRTDATPSEVPGERLLLLALGVGAEPGLESRIDRAIDRDALVARFLPGGTPTRGVLASHGSVPAAPAPAEAPPVDLRLTTPPWNPGGTRLVGRVQYDLARAGIQAPREEPPPDWDRMRRVLASGRFELMMVSVDLPVAEAPVDRMWDLVALAAWFGRTEAVPAPLLIGFAAASPEERGRRVDQLEASLRDALRLVPLARSRWRVDRPSGLVGVARSAEGGLRFDEAHPALGRGTPR